MSGEKDLQTILKSMSVSCDNVRYGFAIVPSISGLEFNQLQTTFKESEGLAIHASEDYLVSKGLNSEGPFAKLTIDIHTSLEMVGLTAVMAKKLADNGISANVVAGFYHDHIFVQYDLREKAIAALLELKDIHG